MPTEKPLRILCIHGYRQNAQMFREKTGSFRKAVKKHAEFVYITAPHLVPPGNMGSAAWAQVREDESKGHAENAQQNSSDGEGERGWWFSRQDDYFKAVDHSDIEKGFEESLTHVVGVLEKEREENGGFDGIMGFSQGATFVSLLSLIQDQEKQNWFKFAILVAGFKSRLIPHEKYYSQSKVQIPSLHVIGEDDKVISTDMGLELMSYFHEPTRISHPGGHFVPASSAQKQGYIEFLEKMKHMLKTDS